MSVPIRYMVAFSALMACAAVQAADQVYRYLDADGKPIYSSLPPPAGTRYERVDASPAGGPGKGKASEQQSRRDDRDKARHSTAGGAVPFREQWLESERKAGQATREPVPVVKPVATPANPGTASPSK